VTIVKTDLNRSGPPSGFAIPASAPSQTITAAGPVTVRPGDQVIAINKAAPSATPITLPSVSARQPSGAALWIYDWSGLGGDITVTPAPGENIMGATGPWTVGSGGVAQSGGSLMLIPSMALNGWLVR
jgi:hypothetical protein